MVDSNIRRMRTARGIAIAITLAEIAAWVFRCTEIRAAIPVVIFDDALQALQRVSICQRRGYNLDQSIHKRTGVRTLTYANTLFGRLCANEGVLLYAI